MRIPPDTPLAPQRRGAALTIWIDDQPVVAYAGETLATVLLAAGRRALYRPGADHPMRARGLYCGMGVCFECLVWVAPATAPGALRSVRACLTPAEDGMRVHTGAQPPQQQTCEPA